MKARLHTARATSIKREPIPGTALFADLDAHDIEVETCLLPELVAEFVLGEAEAAVRRRLSDAMSIQLVRRATLCYRRNPRFLLTIFFFVGVLEYFALECSSLRWSYFPGVAET